MHSMNCRSKCDEIHELQDAITMSHLRTATELQSVSSPEQTLSNLQYYKCDCDVTLALVQKQVQCILQACKSKSNEDCELMRVSEMNLLACKCNRKKVCDLQQ